MVYAKEVGSSNTRVEQTPSGEGGNIDLIDFEHIRHVMRGVAGGMNCANDPVADVHHIAIFHKSGGAG
jgi:hypothetical protein